VTPVILYIFGFQALHYLILHQKRFSIHHEKWWLSSGSSISVGPNAVAREWVTVIASECNGAFAGEWCIRPISADGSALTALSHVFQHGGPWFM